MKTRSLVVGNGSSLLGGKLGSSIDSFENVIRINNFLLNGYEEDVGEKVDTWVTTLYHNVFEKRALSIEASKFFMPFNRVPISEGWKDSFSLLKSYADARGIPCDHPSEEEIVNLMEGLGSLASSGVTALNHFIEKEGAVSAVGFDFFKKPGHHYFNLDESRPTGCPHNGEFEQKWFSDQVSRGRIILLEKEGEGLDEYLIDQYRELHLAKPSYGRINPIHPKAIEWARGRKLSRVLDFGCGKGVLFKQLREYGVDASGYDPAIPEFEEFPKNTFQGVCCTDVMEHIPPNSVGKTLGEIGSLAEKTIFLNISTRKAVCTLPDGRNCHETVRDHVWWRSQILKHLPQFRISHDHDLGDEYLAVLVHKS